MRALSLGFAIACAFVASSCASTQHSFSAQCPLAPAQIEAIDATVQAAIDAHFVPGVSLAVAVDGARYHRSYGYADLESGAPVTDDTAFWVMSLNKTFTAAAIMLLAERGQLNLDDALSRYLPDFPHADEVTIRQLLNHTSGVREFLAQPTARREPFITMMSEHPDYSVREMLPYLADMTPDLFEFAPGSAWKYSNSNYILLGAVIEQASGESWKDFLRRNFFAPLGLRNTDVDDLRDDIPNRARGYVMNDAGAFRRASDLPRNIAGPAGSLRSTAQDLLTWQLALNEGRVLAPASVQAMRAPARLNDDRLVQETRPAWTAADAEYLYSYGLGFMLLDDGVRHAYGHIGNFPGYEAVLQTYPDQNLTLALITNRSEAATSLAPRITQAILDNAPTNPSGCSASP